uniref:F-box domain-containing protein n=1 Tax=Macrostomum lignano TaxID=282301 RepID=A0A1I8FQB1_9PLAT
SSLTFADLPAKLMIKVFSYLSHSELCRICPSSAGANSPTTATVDESRLRPEFGGLSVSNVSQFVDLIGSRFSTALSRSMTCHAMQVLHLMALLEQSSEEEEEIYEVINISKIRSAHAEPCACSWSNAHMMAVDWEHSHVKELDITSTELSANCLENVLTRIRSLEYLAVGYCDFFTDANPMPVLAIVDPGDGGYYEMANSNFERAQRSRVVRTFNRYATSIVQLLSCYAGWNEAALGFWHERMLVMKARGWQIEVLVMLVLVVARLLRRRRYHSVVAESTVCGGKMACCLTLEKM